MLETNIVEKIKIHLLCSVTFFWKSCCLRDNVKKCDGARQARDDNKMWHMCFACWITVAANTLTEYVVLIAFSWQVWLHKCTSVLCYMYIASPLQILYQYCTVKQPLLPSRITHRTWNKSNVNDLQIAEYIACGLDRLGADGTMWKPYTQEICNCTIFRYNMGRVNVILSLFWSYNWFALLGLSVPRCRISETLFPLPCMIFL
jgi:hypothetical protein